MIKIIGHRGCKGHNNPPENSIESFLSAIKQSADGIEMDVFLTKDNELVVFHDDTLERMTEGKGNITSFTLRELKKLHLKDNSGKLTSLGIPTLDEVLQLIEGYIKKDKKLASNFVVNIEIKGLGISSYIIKIVKKYLGRGFTLSNFAVSSFDMKTLNELRQHSPEIPIAALFEGGSEPWDISEDQLKKSIETNKNLKPITVNITLPSINANTIAMIKNIGAEAVAWTCNEKSPDLMEENEKVALRKKIKESGISAMITDYPAQIRKLLQ